MALRKITPTENAIHTLIDLRKQVDLALGELRALLPRRRPDKAKGIIKHPITGVKHHYKFNRK